MSPAPAAIDARALAKRFGATTAVDAISFAIEKGSVTGLLGGNGAGKTTTIGMIMGLIVPTSGAVSVLGVDMASDRYRVLGRMNFESPYVDMPHRLTVRQNLWRVRPPLWRREPRTRASTSSRASLALEPFLDRPAGSLSAGQKTRVALAKALINEPEVLLLDEPTASLDPDTADWVRARLEAFRRARGATILLASHNMGEVERLCDRVVMLKQGRIVDDGSPRDLVARYGRANLEEVFLDVARRADRGSPGMSLERGELSGFSPGARRRDGDALPLSHALVLAAPGRARLLAGGADDDLGLPADLYPRPGRGVGRRAARWRSPAAR